MTIVSRVDKRRIVSMIENFQAVKIKENHITNKISVMLSIHLHIIQIFGTHALTDSSSENTSTGSPLDILLFFPCTKKKEKEKEKPADFRRK